MGARTALPLAAALWLGILAARPAGAAALGLLSLGTTAAATLSFFVRARGAPRLGALLLALSMAFAGMARGGAHRAALEHQRRALDPERLVRLEAQVIEPPNLAADHVAIVARVVKAEPGSLAGVRLRLRLPQGTAVEWGDAVECLARLDPPGPPRNPGGFDTRASAIAAGLAASGRALSAVVTPPRGARRLVRVTFARWRRGIEARLARGLSPAALELTLPLVTGDRSALSTPLDADLRSAGLIHLLALSGLHVSAMAAVARSLAASAGGGVAARALAGMVAALLYAGLAGPVPSLMRAVVSECWLGAGRMLRRPADPVQGLGVTALVLLVLSPGWGSDLGFQLSCTASLGLAAVGGPLTAAAGRWRPLAAALGATLAAQVVSAPILIARVHGLSWPGLAANLVAVPLSGLLLAAAWLAVLAESALPGAGHFGFSACELFARGLVAVTERAAAWPQALISTGHEPAVAWASALGAFALVIAAGEPRPLDHRGLRRTPFGEAALGGGLWASALAIGLALSAREPRPPAGRAWLVALDVGQGDAIALAFADGWWLVDAGGRSPRYDAGESVVRPFLRWAAVRRLRVLALTHDDGDHTGGAAAVLRSVGADTLLGPVALPGVPGPLARFAKPVPVRRTILRSAARGDTLRRDVRVCVLWPPRAGGTADTTAAVALASRGDNAAGLVIEIAAGETRALLMADVDSLDEAAIALDGRVALLKVGHHGSASSTGASFLARAAPREAWISSGAHNVYGHPSPLTLERLVRARVRVKRTDREGALWVELGAGGIRRTDWRGHDPFADESRRMDSRPFPAPAAAPRAP